MKETLICSLEKHHIYLLSNSKYGFYIFVPFKDYTETNISVRLKSNYQNYDLNKNSLDVVTNELINYYKDLDNYNITLILPVFYDDVLSRIVTVDDIEKYQVIDRCLGEMFNYAYMFLAKFNVKVNSNIYIINNDSFKRFTNWFVARYTNRVEYKTILELIKQNGDFSNYNVMETPNINFVVGRNEVPSIDKTVEIEQETFDAIANEANETDNKAIKRKESGGFVSYILLGVVTFVVSMALLWFFVK